MANVAVIEKKFEQMGARVRIREPRATRGLRSTPERPVSVDILRDHWGEFFDIQVSKEIELLVMDVQKKDRHLLLLARDPDNPQSKFLCGHDERHWFTSAIPEAAGASNVRQAKNALKPQEVVEAERRGKVKKKDLHKRRRRAVGGKLIRQGEFVFIPAPDLTIDEKSFKTTILRNEPMRGGGANFHRAEYMYRRGGVTVHVCTKHPNGITGKEYKDLLRKNSEAKRWNWQTMRRNADAFAKGRITHPEHATVNLGDVWHRISVNTESQARAARNVTFLD